MNAMKNTVLRFATPNCPDGQPFAANRRVESRRRAAGRVESPGEFWPVASMSGSFVATNRAGQAADRGHSLREITPMGWPPGPIGAANHADRQPSEAIFHGESRHYGAVLSENLP